MFENEQKYIVKIADDIQRIQEERDRFMAIQHPSNNLIISEHVERAGGV